MSAGITCYQMNMYVNSETNKTNEVQQSYLTYVIINLIFDEFIFQFERRRLLSYNE